ncbi:MAG: DNA-directed RNA polymerase subunit omega [bacterium]|nr:DNA-directed RNA polymerase subunit omega [bacterium]
MISDDIDELLKRVNDKYLLVVIAAKRAHQLMKGGEKLVDIDSNKVTSITLAELAKGKIELKEDA